MKITNSRGDRTRSAIKEAALQLFSEQGYTGTSMRDIADAVGLRPGSLYAHITSKEELLIDIVESGIHSFIEIRSLIESMSASAEEKLRTAIKRHITLVAENPARTLIVFHQWRYLTEPNRSRAMEKRRSYAQLFTDILNEGIQTNAFNSELDTRVEIFTILGALNWTSEWFSAKGSYTPEQIGDKITDTLIYGLRARS